MSSFAQDRPLSGRSSTFGPIVHFRADRPLSRDLLLQLLRILHFGPNSDPSLRELNYFIRKSVKEGKLRAWIRFLSGFAKN